MDILHVLDPKMPVAHYPRPLPSLRVDTQLNAGGGGEDQKESREGVGEEKLGGDISLNDLFSPSIIKVESLKLLMLHTPFG